MLFYLASALINKPESGSRLRDLLTALLWCNHRAFVVDAKHVKRDIPQSVVDGFLVALFGRHVTQQEAEEWLAIKEYLGMKEEKEEGEKEKEPEAPVEGQIKATP